MNRYSPISDISPLSEASRESLVSNGFEKLEDFDEIDFTRISKLIHKTEQRAVFEATLKAGVSVIFEKEISIFDFPGISFKFAEILDKSGYKKLCDFEGCDYNKIYDLITFGVGKRLLVGLVLAGVRVEFDKPGWTSDEWKVFVENAVRDGLLSWEDVAVSICSEMNPPQVGTAVANAVKHNYPKGKTMQNVWRWLYQLDGKCVASGKRLFLEADHINPREYFVKQGRDVKDADRLENFQLLSKRENVIKRGSHKLGGLSFAPAAAVLIYILLRFKPLNYYDFVKLCRRHGLTMAEIRFQEGWAFAVWLSKTGEYKIEGEPAPFIREMDDSQIDPDQ